MSGNSPDDFSAWEAIADATGGGTRRDFLARTGGALAAVAVFGSLPAGASAALNVQESGTLRIAYSDADPTNDLDPAHAGETLDTTILNMLYDPLLGSNRNWAVLPALASSWKFNSTGRVLTLNLRQGVQFHDGSPFTATDVVYSLRRHLDKSVGSKLYGDMSANTTVDGIQAVDAHTVRITLLHTNYAFVNTLQTRFCCPIKNGTATPDGVGTGPFKLGSFTPGQSFQFSKNSQYWQRGLPILSSVQAVVIPDQATKVLRVLQGTSDLVDPIDTAEIALVKKSTQAKIVGSQGSIRYTFELNSKFPPFDDPYVIGAIKAALDRQKMLKVGLQGYGDVLYDVPIGLSSPLFPKALQRDPSIKMAKELLRKGGHKNGVSFDFHTSNVYGAMLNLSVLFKQLLAPAGIRVNLKQEPANTYWGSVWAKVPAYMNYWFDRAPYTALFQPYWSTSSVNLVGFHSHAFDHQLAAAVTSRVEADRAKALKRAAYLAGKGASEISPVLAEALWVLRNNVSGLVFDKVFQIDIKRVKLS